MDSRPTLILTSAAQVNAWARAGRPVVAHYTIQAAPRGHYGELGDGRVEVFRPNPIEWEAGLRLVTARREGRPMDERDLRIYRGSMEARWEAALARGELTPGRLRASRDGISEPLLADGAALTCACSAAEARAGRCHRTWAAPYLARAGWRVVLDGVEVSP